MVALDQYCGAASRLVRVRRRITLALARRCRQGTRVPGVSRAPAADLTKAAPVQSLYESCLTRLDAGAPVITLDLRGVTQADTKLVAVLVALHRYARASGQQVRVLCSDPVRAWLRVYRLDALAIDDAV